jgi:hypothetical protein
MHDFTLIEQIVKSLEDIQVFFRKYIIIDSLFRFVSVFWRHLTPSLKRVFCQDYNGAFRFKGGNVRWDIYN